MTNSKIPGQEVIEVLGLKSDSHVAPEPGQRFSFTWVNRTLTGRVLHYSRPTMWSILKGDDGQVYNVPFSNLGRRC